MDVVGLGLAGTTAGFLRARAEAERTGMISDSLQDVLAMADPLDEETRHALELQLGKTVRTAVALPAELERCLDLGRERRSAHRFDHSKR